MTSTTTTTKTKTGTETGSRRVLTRLEGMFFFMFSFLYLLTNNYWIYRYDHLHTSKLHMTTTTTTTRRRTERFETRIDASRRYVFLISFSFFYILTIYYCDYSSTKHTTSGIKISPYHPPPLQQHPRKHPWKWLRVEMRQNASHTTNGLRRP